MFELVQPDKRCGKATLSAIVCVPSFDRHTGKCAEFNKHTSDRPIAYTVVGLVLEDGSANGTSEGCSAASTNHVQIFFGSIDDLIMEVLNWCQATINISHANRSIRTRHDETHRQQQQANPHGVFTRRHHPK